MSFERPINAFTYTPVVRDAESMLELVLEYGIIPFFENPIPGFSVEEHTLPECWFTEDNLGPWDWKIHCVQSGQIAYGKFLWGGKAAFATVDIYRELMNWRRSLPKYAPAEDQQLILDYVGEHGAIGIPEVRNLLGVKKAVADNLIARLQMQTRLVTGDITRVYRGANLTYSGWQRSSFCTPESLFFEDLGLPFPGYHPVSAKTDNTPAQSLEFLKEHISSLCGPVQAKTLEKLLG